MKRAFFFPRIDTHRGKLAIVVNARINGGEAHDVYKVLEDGKAYARNLMYYGMSGYFVTFPNEQLERYFSPAIKNAKSICQTDRGLTDQETALIASHYPGFAFTMSKGHLNFSETWRALAIWKEYPQIEHVLCAGFKRLALNKSVYKLGAKSKKVVMDYMRTNKGDYKVSLEEVLLRHKYKMSETEFCDYKYYCSVVHKVGVDLFRYLNNLGETFRIGIYTRYMDYIQAAKDLGHDVNDPYWRFPKDFSKAHEKVMEQLERVTKMRKEKELEQKQNDYMAKVQELIGKEIERGGFKVFVPGDVRQFVAQAEALNQCLITMDYAKKVIEGQCVLLFITKDGKPSSTAEILCEGHKLGQFYGDEKLRDCDPSEDEKALVMEWMTKFYNESNQRRFA